MAMQNSKTPQTYWVNPEWKIPKDELKPNLASEEPTTEWLWAGEETMHPCWAVRRLTPAKIANEPKGSNAVAFNMGLKEFEYTNVSVGTFQRKSITLTMMITVPMLTNTKPITKGTELVLEVGTPVKKENTKKETWKGDVKKDQ